MIKALGKQAKGAKGITLIGLTVTIVVILAGISIGVVFSEDGIIAKAKEAANATNNAVQKEQEDLDNLADYLNQALNGIGGNTNTNTRPDNPSDEGSGGIVNIKFLKGITEEAADGTTTWDNASGEGNWNIHPAFNYNGTVSGLWVAKFEASSIEGNSDTEGGDNVTTKVLQVKPGVSSWRYISVGNAYTVCLNYNPDLSSHMIKNSEWRAVAYLTQSSFGKNEEVWVNNSSSFITGSAGNSASASSITVIEDNGSKNITITNASGNTKIIAENGYAIYNNGSGQITISGGTIQVTNSTGLYNASTGNVTIQGGTIKMLGSYIGIQNQSTGTVRIENMAIDTENGQPIVNNAGGRIEIISGSFKARGETTPSVVNSGEGHIQVEGGEIEAASAGIYNIGEGSITILAGTVTSTAANAIGNASTGEITLGENDGTISTTSPEIVSTNGYYTISTSTLNFYDGILKGGGIKEGTTVNTPSGKTAVRNTSAELYYTILQ